MDEGRRRRRSEDRLSGLPDELLVGLRSVRAAARTSLLSRRWRHIWTQIPQLVLFNRDEPSPVLFLDYVDSALAIHSAPAIELLSILLPDTDSVPACRVAPWLRGASQRVVGTINVYVPRKMSRHDHVLREEEELEIPSCGGATRVLLNLDQRWRLRFQLGGLFVALSHLTIVSARVEGSDLSCLVSTICPCLESLFIGVSVILPTVSDVSMRTDSLQSLVFYANNTRCLEVIAPWLQQLTLCDVESHMISAPKLAKLHWNGNGHDPGRHEFADVPCYPQLLKINRKSVVASLLQRFDSVDELKLGITVPREGYRSFLNETDRLPKYDEAEYNAKRSMQPSAPTVLRPSSSSRSCYPAASRPATSYHGFAPPRSAWWALSPSMCVSCTHWPLRRKSSLHAACGGARTMLLNLNERWRLRLQPGRLFAALSHLIIESARVEGSDLSCLVSTQCPCLENLFVGVTLRTVSDVSMRSDSLQSLGFFVGNTRRLEVVYPRLKQLTVSNVEYHKISAPKLAKLDWNANVHDTRRHEFADVPRHLQLLKINRKSVVASMLQRNYVFVKL
ncbi:hypothetical protein EJB05_12148, partial [Eragrostis curvula]